MPNVTIVTGFTFQHDDGFKEFIPPGVYELDDDMANHFQVLGHSDNPPPPRTRAGMSQAEAAQAASVEDKTAPRFKRAVLEPQRTRPHARATLDEHKAEQHKTEEHKAE